MIGEKKKKLSDHQKSTNHEASKEKTAPTTRLGREHQPPAQPAQLPGSVCISPPNSFIPLFELADIMF